MTADDEIFPPACWRRFQAQRLLAEGGYGSVWLAEERGLARPVVVKLLKTEAAADAEGATRFADEARVTATLSHPNIVVVLDHGVGESVPWIAYELLGGVDLRARLSQPVSIDEAVAIMRDVTAGVAEAHRHGIQHRDLKPENVMSDTNGRWKVTDFGIAKWAGSRVRTATGIIVGTPFYLSPEQVSGEKATARSDVYALGIMLYELLVGEVPFGGDQVFRVLELQVRSRVPSPRAARPEVPEWLDRAVLAATAREPDQRLPDAGALAELLERGAAAAKRPSGTARIVKPRPSRSAATVRVAPAAPSRSPLAAAAGLAAVLLAVGAWWSLRKPALAPPPTPVRIAASMAGPPPAPAPATHSLAPPKDFRSSTTALENALFRRRKNGITPKLKADYAAMYRERIDRWRRADRRAALENARNWLKAAEEGRADGRVEALTRLAELQVEEVRFLPTGAPLDAAIATLEKLAASTVDPLVRGRLGALLSQRGDRAAAIPHLRAAIEREPHGPWLFDLAEALAHQGNLTDAWPVYQMAAKKGGMYAWQLVNSARRFPPGEPPGRDRPCELYRAALVADPQSQPAKINVAQCELRAGNSARALALAQEVVDAEPVLWAHLGAMEVYAAAAPWTTLTSSPGPA